MDEIVDEMSKNTSKADFIVRQAKLGQAR